MVSLCEIGAISHAELQSNTNVYYILVQQNLSTNTVVGLGVITTTTVVGLGIILVILSSKCQRME